MDPTSTEFLRSNLINMAAAFQNLWRKLSNNLQWLIHLSLSSSFIILFRSICVLLNLWYLKRNCSPRYAMAIKSQLLKVLLKLSEISSLLITMPCQTSRSLGMVLFWLCISQQKLQVDHLNFFFLRKHNNSLQKKSAVNVRLLFSSSYL